MIGAAVIGATVRFRALPFFSALVANEIVPPLLNWTRPLDPGKGRG
ncbi:MAG: hypothetical protein U0793_10245 [Gemmataceae bacterium]